jgi:PBSX family phage portal protein
VVVKADVLEGSRVDITSIVEMVFNDERRLPGGALSPPYDFVKLYRIYESSSWLRPCVEAYLTNIDSFGHHFMPAIDLSSKLEADTRVRDAIFYERVLAQRDNKISADKVIEPTDAEVEERKTGLQRVARLEYARLRAFFNYVCPQFSFVELRRRTRQDLEVTGNAFWEITRNRLKELANIYYVKPLFIRLMPEGEADVEIVEKIKVTDISWMEVKRFRRFRKYMLIRKKSKPVYFKEYGDPRVMSRQTGAFYASEEDMLKKERNALPGTELVHFNIPTPADDYGVPRWISNLPAVLGSRELDEVNLNYFHNNVVPPLALLCSGGRFGKGVAQRIEEYIDEHLKGKKGIHRILVIEAESQKGSGGDAMPRQVPKIQFVPLRETQLQDALFQDYDKANEMKIAQSFRLPRLLRGDDQHINRATAIASLKFAEEQVFEPERHSFDVWMDRHIMAELGITFWTFRSNSPLVRDPEATAMMIERLMKVGVLLPSEARQLAADIFNRAFAVVSEEWSNRPLPLLLAQLRGGGDVYALESEPPANQPADEDMDERPRPTRNDGGRGGKDTGKTKTRNGGQQVPRMPRPVGRALPPIGGDLAGIGEEP